MMSPYEKFAPDHITLSPGINMQSLSGRVCVTADRTYSYRNVIGSARPPLDVCCGQFSNRYKCINHVSIVWKYS